MKYTKSEKSSPMKNYVYYQPNPKGRRGEKNRCDCVVRAIAKFLGIDWLDAYNQLCEAGRRTYDMPNSRDSIKFICSEWGARYTAIKVEVGCRRPTVESFAQEHPKGRYLLSVANHEVCIEDGFYYDTWDCGHKCVYSYWEI